MIMGLEIICAVGLIFVAWRWFKIWSYWKVRGITSYGYPPPIGCLLPIWTGRLTVGELTQEVFEKNPTSKIVGSWILFKPIILMKDPQLVHQILSEDFSSWPDRGFKDDPTLDPLSQHLINLGGIKWKTVRSWLASGFGMVGMRDRHDILVQESEIFVRSLISSSKFDVVKRSKESAFAILSRISLGTREAPPVVQQLIHEAFSGSFWTTLRSAFRLSFPSFLSSVKCKRFQSDQESSFISIVDERCRTIYSNNNNQDMLQILIDAYKQYQISDSKNGKITYEVIASNAFALLAAGYDTTASTLSWLLLELAKNPDIQDKLYEEIHRVLALHGEPNYAAVKEMHYMDNVLSEVLRMYPSVTLTTRVSAVPTTLDGCHIPAGTRVVVPIYAIQRYPDHFQDPDTFNPDRFCAKDVNMMAFLPFGKGPRICLGRRLAELTLKLSLIAVFKDFTISVASDTKLPVGYSTNSLFLEPKNPIILKIRPRN